MLLQGACNFVDIGGELITNAEGLCRALKALEGKERIADRRIQLYETDHVLAPEGMTIATLLAHQRAGRTAVAVLYGAPGTPGFKDLHGALMQSALAGLCRVLPPVYPCMSCSILAHAELCSPEGSCCLPFRCAAMPAISDMKRPQEHTCQPCL